MPESLTYKDAGVDLDRADRISTNIKQLIRDTFSPRVMDSGPGFAGLFSLNYAEKIFVRDYDNPILLGATDGVGTKLKVAFRADRHRSIGVDLVAMNVNDLMAQGGEPLFFLDYISSGKLREGVVEEIVEGIVHGCKQANTALLGGETAEMPGFYDDGEYDLAGFCVGVAEDKRIIKGDDIKPGDIVIGLPSSGIHANGTSLARMAFFEKANMTVDDVPSGFDRTVGELLLTPTRIYAPALERLFNRYRSRMPLKGIAHITGGGLRDNIRRVLPDDCNAELDPSTWERPPIFDLIRRTGNVELEEMYRSFNMGIGMTIICDPYFEDSIPGHIDEFVPGARTVGRITEGRGTVKINGVFD